LNWDAKIAIVLDSWGNLQIDYFVLKNVTMSLASVTKKETIAPFASTGSASVTNRYANKGCLNKIN
jgi:hypothetical protein